MGKKKTKKKKKYIISRIVERNIYLLFVKAWIQRRSLYYCFQLADSADSVINAAMDYHIEIITRDDKHRVLKFLRRFFFRDEPLNQNIALIPEGEDSTCLELEDYCSKSSLENNLSLMAVSSTGAIIGVLLNGEFIINLSVGLSLRVHTHIHNRKKERERETQYTRAREEIFNV